jgi:HemK-like putative methylase
LKEHVAKSANHSKPQQLSKLCRKRGRGVPLQYVLGSQPFGSLDILCRPGVLIPRPETEAYTYQLVELIKAGRLLDTGNGALTILDFCTGTGCIPLLLFSALQSFVLSLSVRGVDLSPVALQLSEANVAHNVKAGLIRQPIKEQRISFDKVDVFNDSDIQALTATTTGLDLMISNPPYISKNTWNYGRGDMGYSVRKYEPRLALVPGDHLRRVADGLEQEDIFYQRLLDIALLLQPKALLLEVGDEAQAHRVARFSSNHDFASGKFIELWRDWPDLPLVEKSTGTGELTTLKNTSLEVPIRGEGNVRSVLIKSSVK